LGGAPIIKLLLWKKDKIKQIAKSIMAKLPLVAVVVLKTKTSV